jgi:uncharacterized protein YlaI
MTTMTNETNNEENSPEMHICKICGQKIEAKLCANHLEETGHDEFKPVSNCDQQLKGGSEK